MKRVLIAAVIGVVIAAFVFIYLPTNKAPKPLTNDSIPLAQLSNNTSANQNISNLESNISNLEAPGFVMINHTPAKTGYASITVYRPK